MKNNKKWKFMVVFILFSNLLLVNGVFAQEGGIGISQNKDTIGLLYGSKPKRFLTESVSYVLGGDMNNVPTANPLLTLAGRATGISKSEVDGLPGFENGLQNVRGYHTFGDIKNATILVDGRPDDIRMIDPYDIESITVLKDAASTVLYGLQSANGVILINTKRAREGKIKIGFNHQTSFLQPIRFPKYLDSYNYALLYNEAMLNDNPNATPKYDQTALDGYQKGEDPYRYPNVNWREEFLKDYTVQTRTNLNISGGNRYNKFYVAADYYNVGGIYNVDKDVNTYNTNTNLNIFTLHGNVATTLFDKLHVTADLRLKRDNRNGPASGLLNGSFASTLFTTIYGTPFNAHPIVNPDGSIAGTNEYRNNPYGLLNYKGYVQEKNYTMSSFVDVTYDFGGFLKGLKIKGLIGYDNYNDYYINRIKNFAVYQLQPDGSYNKIGTDSQTGNTGGYDHVYMNYQHYLSLFYSNVFGDHAIDAFLMYERIQSDETLTSNKLFNNYQGPKGKVSYRFKNKYLLDFAFSYQGSEQFSPSHRYGFFPAVSGGWIVTDENFLKNNPWLNFFKIRASYGITGNMPGGIDHGYLGAYSTGGGSYFGVTPGLQSGWIESRVENPAFTWEKNRIVNVGTDLELLKNRFALSFDYFSEKNHDIIVNNALPAMYGASVYAPVGKFANKGFELQIGWRNHIGDFGYSIDANYSIAQNKIVDQSEEIRAYDWMKRTGKPTGAKFGYVFDRFFTEDDVISALPDQSQLGTQKPGDLKFKDLNGDNVIDQYDITYIGKAKMPEIYYGVNIGLTYKKLDLSAFFEGSGNSTTYNSGYTYWEFYNKTGNVLEHHLDRWVPGSGQAASYPRLTLNNPNNFQYNSYWVQDNSFLRFKYLEVGYNVPYKLIQKVGMSQLRIFVNGNNLYCWDKIKVKDPDGPDNGLSYPLTLTFSAGLNIIF